MLYLCSPYSHPDQMVRQYRYQKACRATAKLIAAGIPVFSPLCNSVPAVELGGLDASHSDFMAIDIPILRRCDEILILGLPQWKESLGVKKEIVEGLAFRLPITLIEEADIEQLPAIPKTARTFLKSAIFTEATDGN